VSFTPARCSTGNGTSRSTNCAWVPTGVISSPRWAPGHLPAVANQRRPWRHAALLNQVVEDDAQSFRPWAPSPTTMNSASVPRT
jgi:hypothetical protein